MRSLLKILRGLLGLGAVGAVTGGALVAALAAIVMLGKEAPLRELAAESDPPAQLPSPENRV